MQALENDETFQCASVNRSCMLSNDIHLKAMHSVVRMPKTFALKYTLVLKCRVLGIIRFMNENEMSCFLLAVL